MYLFVVGGARCCNLVSFVHENEFVLLFALICLINYIFAHCRLRLLFLILFFFVLRLWHAPLPGGNLSIGCAGNQINNEAAASVAPSASAAASVAVTVGAGAGNLKFV